MLRGLFIVLMFLVDLIIYVQVDSMLGRRENPGEHEAMRKMKNEFMMNWDGLRGQKKKSEYWFLLPQTGLLILTRRS